MTEIVDQPKTFSKEELFTPTLLYSANFWPLTAIQWQIINRLNIPQILLGASAGCLLTFIAEIPRKFASNGSVELVDFSGIAIVLIFTVLIVVIGRLFDSRRKKLIKKISDHLLSDSEIGI